MLPHFGHCVITLGTTRKWPLYGGGVDANRLVSSRPASPPSLASRNSGENENRKSLLLDLASLFSFS
jgi:hypothetical protein